MYSSASAGAPERVEKPPELFVEGRHVRPLGADIILDEGHQLALDLLQFGSILLVGIFQVLERAARIDIVARIDAHLLAIEGSDIGGMGREVNVGH